MSGFARFLRKESMETVRTWRLWVLPGLLVFFALTSPVVAKLTPLMLDSMLQGQSGVQITIPDPTYLDGYAQWVKNLQQIVSFALLLTAGGMVASEVSSGTAVLVLTKSVSRGAFVVAKFFSHASLLVLATSLGTLLCWIATRLTFGDAPAQRLISSSAAWLAFALLLLSAMTLFSTRLGALAAGGAGIGVFFALSVLSLWGPAARYSPAGVASAPGALLAGSDVALLWPLLTTAMAVVLLLACAVASFSRREI